MARWPREDRFCHHRPLTANACLDAAAYFAGHGFNGVRCLRGGIDAWAREVDPKMRRYKLA